MNQAEFLSEFAEKHANIQILQQKVLEIQETYFAEIKRGDLVERDIRDVLIDILTKTLRGYALECQLLLDGITKPLDA